MELTQLYYFRTVAKTQNITAAAAQLHITQPTLSKVIKRLEEDLGAQLFDRRASKLTLNPLGEAYLVYVETALDALYRGQQCITQMQTGAKAGIRLATTFEGIPSMLIEQFTLLHPHISLTEVNVDPEEITSLLLNDHIDFALTLSPLEQLEIEEIACIIEPLLLLLPDEMQTKGIPVCLSDYEQEHFAIFEGGKDSYATILQCSNQAGFVPVITYRTSRSQRIHELVNTLNVCSLVPSHMILHNWEQLSERTREHLLMVDNPRCHRTIHLYRRRIESPTEELRLFAEYASLYFDNANMEITQLLCSHFADQHSFQIQ